ncbi:hypothetical protein HQ535_16545 [bacterium]|nr:hypothetical protein [bacterium]
MNTWDARVLGATVGAVVFGLASGGSGTLPGIVVGVVLAEVYNRRDRPESPPDPWVNKASDPVPGSPDLRVEAFIADAVDQGVITVETAQALQRFHRRRLVEPERDRAEDPQPVPRPTVAPSPSKPATPSAVPDSWSPPVTPTPAARQRSASPEPGPARTPSPAPRYFDGLKERLSRLRREVASDLAVHGFSYVGMALTFVGVFGYMFFSFQDLEDKYQPIVEAIIPTVFFGWAWYLRRHAASIVARVLELLGGLVLPVILYAALVDNAPVPPDLTGDLLIGGLVVVAALIAALYWWWSARHEESGLHYLVGPVLWLGALAAGFVFKADEPLVGPAITRLVSPQGATAAVGVAITLLVAYGVGSRRFRNSVMVAAVPAVPIAYAITVGLSIGEDWSREWPILIAGVASLVSIELLARHFERIDEVRLIEPIAMALVIVPLGFVLGPDWTGAVSVIVYLAWFEWNLPEGPAIGAGPALALAGVGAGLVLSIAEPWAATVAFGLVSLWSHLRRRTGLPIERSTPLLSGTAALLPVGFAYSLVLATRNDVAWLVLGSIAMAVAIAIRVTRSRDGFLTAWLLAVSLAVAVGSAYHWFETVGVEPQLVPTLAALAATAISSALMASNGASRIWLTSVPVVMGIAVTLDAWNVTGPRMWEVWSLVGVAAVGAACGWRKPPAGHLGLLGHSLGAVALVGAVPDGSTALIAWTGGWVLTTITEETGGDSAGGLITRAMGNLSWTRAAEVSRAIPGIFMTASAPFAMVAMLGWWNTFAERRSWTGAALSLLAVAYAIITRVLTDRRPLSTVLAAGAMVLAVVGIAVAAPVAWPSLMASAALVAVALILGGPMGNTLFAWLAWAMSGVFAAQLAYQAGVSSGSLHLVVFAWATLLLGGSIAADRVIAGPRETGVGIRVVSLHPCRESASARGHRGAGPPADPIGGTRRRAGGLCVVGPGCRRHLRHVGIGHADRRRHAARIRLCHPRHGGVGGPRAVQAGVDAGRCRCSPGRLLVADRTSGPLYRRGTRQVGPSSVDGGGDRGRRGHDRFVRQRHDA